MTTMTMQSHVHVHVYMQLERVNGRRQLCSLSMHTRARTVDLKLIFVPLIFLLLRIWSSIIDVPVFYLHDEEFTKTPVNAALVLLAVSFPIIYMPVAIIKSCRCIIEIKGKNYLSYVESVQLSVIFNLLHIWSCTLMC